MAEVTTSETPTKNNTEGANTSEQPTREKVANHSFPLGIKDIIVTGLYEESRQNPTPHKHAGLDFPAAKGTPVLATEDNGKVVKVAPNNGNAGNTVDIEYTREDGSKYKIRNFHLDSMSVKEGDIVKAGQQIGTVGSTGYGSGPHLHFEAHQINADGSTRRVDPSAYLCEIKERGVLDNTLSKKGSGENLMAKYANPNIPNNPAAKQQPLTMDQQIKAMMSQMGFGGKSKSTGDGLMDIVIDMLLLVLFAGMMGEKLTEEEKAKMIENLQYKKVDISRLTPNLKSCELSFGGENHVLTYTNEKGTFVHTLTAEEEQEIKDALAKGKGNNGTDPSAVTAIINDIVKNGSATQIQTNDQSKGRDVNAAAVASQYYSNNMSSSMSQVQDASLSR